MDCLCYPLVYSIHGKLCTAFSLVKENKTTATYEIRVSDSFAFRTYVPLRLCTQLSGKPTPPKEICLLACLPENLELCKIASFAEFPSAE